LHWLWRALRLFGGNGGVAFDEGGHDTEGKRGNFEKEQVLGLLGGVSGKNGGLDSRTVGDGLVGVDAHVGLLAIKEVGHELDDTGDTSGTTDEDDFMHVVLVDLGVVEDIERSCAVSWVVGDDLNTIVLPDTNASETKKKFENRKKYEEVQQSTYE